MPTYVYGLQAGSGVVGCAHCRETFEAVQRMSDPPLTVCPQCGAPIVRRVQAPMVSDSGKLKGPSAKAMAQAGFTQYKRSGKGTYEKSFGQGPDNLRA